MADLRRLLGYVRPHAPKVLVSVVLMIAATLGTAWLTGRIYRVGILMYGKPPSIREIARWVTQ